MRIILTVTALLALSGCATNPSMEALYGQALATGDWSAVERRERRIASEAAMSACLRRDGRRYCADGDCQCISVDQMQQILRPNPVLQF